MGGHPAFIGKPLVPSLLAFGPRESPCFTRENPARPRVEHLAGDRGDAEAWRRCQGRKPRGSSEQQRPSLGLTSRAVLERYQASRSPGFVYVSSPGVYGTPTVTRGPQRDSPTDLRPQAAMPASLENRGIGCARRADSLHQLPAHLHHRSGQLTTRWRAGLGSDRARVAPCRCQAMAATIHPAPARERSSAIANGPCLEGGSGHQPDLTTARPAKGISFRGPGGRGGPAPCGQEVRRRWRIRFLRSSRA